MTIAGLVALTALIVGGILLARILRRNAAIRAETRAIRRETRMIQRDIQRMRNTGR